MKTVTATLADGRTVEYLPDVIGEGGFKTVHFTPDHKAVVCFFKDQATVDENRMTRLRKILDQFNPTTHPESGAYFAGLFCWPTGIVLGPRRGLTAPAYSGNFFFAEGRWKGQEKKGNWFASPKLRKLLPASERGHWRNYLELCAMMARGVRRMHNAGLAHSDLSCNNVLIDPPNSRCVIIDIDSLVVPGVFPPDVDGTPGYIAPEVLASRHLPSAHPGRKYACNLTDLHALAVLVYEYLLRRHPLRGPKVHAATAEEDDRLSFGEKALFIEHPTDRSNRPGGLTPGLAHLGPYLGKLMTEAFIDGLHAPQKRPTASAWEAGLSKTADLLVPCGNAACEEKWFVHLEGQPIACPFCGWKAKAAVPVLDFHYAPKPGLFRPEGHSLVGYHDRPLFLWHVYANVRPVEGVPTEPVAKVVLHGPQWILLNLKLNSLVSPSGNPVPIGQACPLRPGDEVLLTKEDRGRLVCVRHVK